MRQVTLRVPDDLHDLSVEAAEAQNQSLNSFAIAALLAQVRAKSFSQWRQMVDDSHRSAPYRSLSVKGKNRIKTLSGDESS